MMTSKFGVITEDDTDADVLRVVIQRHLGKATVKKACGKGCAKIKAKANRWIEDFASKGITHVVILHDLDRDPNNSELNSEIALRKLLNDVCKDAPLTKLICIPVEELEAWFWSDPEVLSIVARRKCDAYSEPHRVAKPKEALMKLSRDARSKPRYTTLQNAELAKKLNFELCSKRCESFKQLLGFLESASAPVAKGA